MSAMPNSQVVNLMAAGKSDPKSPSRAKAHLMVAYLKETFEDQSTLSRVGAKRDLERCVMKKDDNPKGLFEKLVAVQFKYAGNKQARISEEDIVTQAIQALPAMYNSTVVGLMDAEARANRDVTLVALKKAVGNFYAVAMKGRSGVKPKEIEGGLTSIDERRDEQDSICKYIKETIATAMQELQMKTMPMGKQSMANGDKNGVGNSFHENGGTNNMGGMGSMSVGETGPMKSVMGVTPEMVMAMIQASKGQGQAQIDGSTMLCYNCGQYGHRSNVCEGPRNIELVAQILKAQGKNPCPHCGRFGHNPTLCWSLVTNAHLRPSNWKGQTRPVEQQAGKAAKEQGNMMMDEGNESDNEFSLVKMNESDIETVNRSLKSMGLSLSDPNVWIGDTGATTHNTAFIEKTVNHRSATSQDNIIGVAGPPVQARTIVDIRCEMTGERGVKKVTLKDVTYVPESRYNLFSLTKMMQNGWRLDADKEVGIKLSKNNREVHFNKTFRTPKGVLYVAIFNRVDDGEEHGTTSELSNPNEGGDRCSMPVGDEVNAVAVTINKAHAMCGHMGHVEARAVCKYYGQELTKKGFQQCVHCGKA